jgi:hypothetical protein
MAAQRKVTTPNGKAIVVPDDFTPEEELAAVEAEDARDEKPSGQIKLRSWSDMLNMPIDTSTGKAFRAKMPTPPRGTLPVLAGMGAALATGGMSIPLQAAISGLAGAGGEGAEQALRGEQLDPVRMAGEGAIQSVAGAAPLAAKPIGRTVAKAGRAMSKFVPGWGTKGLIAGSAWGAASVLPPGLREGTAALATKALTPVAKNAVRASGGAVEDAGRAVSKSATQMTGQAAVKRAPVRMPNGRMSSGGVVVPDSRVPMLPDAIRKIQLLYRLITGQQDDGGTEQ